MAAKLTFIPHILNHGSHLKQARAQARSGVSEHTSVIAWNERSGMDEMDERHGDGASSLTLGKGFEFGFRWRMVTPLP